jgi:hypothetical protein
VNNRSNRPRLGLAKETCARNCLRSRGRIRCAAADAQRQTIPLIEYLEFAQRSPGIIRSAAAVVAIDHRIFFPNLEVTQGV